MIEIRTIEVEDTFAYRHLLFHYETGIHSIVGVNGASKTSIHMALCQCFFNRNPKGVKVDDVSNFITKLPYKIVVTFVKDGETYCVENSKKTGKIKILRGTKDISKQRIPDNLKLIEEILNADFDKFVALTYQTTDSRLALIEEKGDGARKKFLNGLLQYEELDAEHKRMKDRVKELTADLKNLKLTLTRAEEAITPIKEVEPLKNTASFEVTLEDSAEALGDYQHQRNNIHNELKQQTSLLEQADAAINAQERKEYIEDALARFTSFFSTYNAAEKAVKELGTKHTQLSTNLETLRADLRKHIKTKPQEPETICTKCGQSVNAEQAQQIYQKELADYERVFEDYQSSIVPMADEVESTKEKLDFSESELKKWKIKIQLENELEKLNLNAVTSIDVAATKQKVEDLKVVLATIDRKIADTNAEIAQARRGLELANEHNTIQVTREKFNKEIEANNSKLRVQIEETQTEIACLERRLDAANELVELLGPTGYRVHKMKKFINLLNAMLVKYLKKVSNGMIQCLFFITEEGEIDFTVTDADKTLPFTSWSNGEKARVKIACLFAILEILEIMGATSFNILTLDEIFSALDDEGKEGLFNVLAYLKGKGKCIYTISHTPLVNDVVFDSVIQVTKEEGIAQVCCLK